eukprot:20569-Heterococcus_DN1.PRE.2
MFTKCEVPTNVYQVVARCQVSTALHCAASTVHNALPYALHRTFKLDMSDVLVSSSISAKQGAAAASTSVANDICCNQDLRVACAEFATAASAVGSCASAAVLLVELQRAVLVCMIACFDVQLCAALRKPCA